MAFSQGYVFGFAAAVCVVCSLAVSSVALGLRDMQETNARRDQHANILLALGLPEDGRDIGGKAIDELWEERVELRVITNEGELAEGDQHDLDGDGDLDQEDLELAREQVKGTGQDPDILGVYVRMDGQEMGALAIPVYGAGLWGPIAGYLAMAPDAQELTGTTFFAPKETPGLGAEIMEDKFEQQFVGKRIVGADGETETIRVVKGQAANLCPDNIEHCVDGVSGATITSRGVDVMIEEGLELYEPYLERIRGR